MYFKTLNYLKDKPVDSYIQVFMIFVWLTGIFATVAIVSGISFLEFIAGLEFEDSWASGTNYQPQTIFNKADHDLH